MTAGGTYTNQQGFNPWW